MLALGAGASWAEPAADEGGEAKAADRTSAVPAGADAAKGTDTAMPPRISAEAVCANIASAAAANGLPTDFFTRLIWQESRFNARAVSRAGAQGIAQFMPGTASWRGLADPFAPAEALWESAEFLRELRAQYGNLGLAAAAYNAGPTRVQDWLAGRRSLPGETRAYVRIITGRTVEDWAASKPPDAIETKTPPGITCAQIAVLLADPRRRSAPPTTSGAWAPWGVQLAGNWSQANALASYEALQRKFAVLRGRSPLVVKNRMPGRGPAAWHRVRVAEQSRESAEKLCAQLKADGAPCIVLRNPRTAQAEIN
jgi:hypothetical protein